MEELLGSSVLIVDDEPHILFSSKVILQKNGVHDVHTLEDGRAVIPFLETHRVAAVVLDLSMPHVSGIDVLSEVAYRYPELPVIIVTGNSEIDMAVESMKRGAFDYLVKPVDPSRFFYSVRKALSFNALKSEVGALRNSLLTGEVRNGDAFSAIVTASPRMRALFRYVEAIAGTEQPVLITGETGTGKELFAKAVHCVSGRRGAFVAVNAAGLDDHMFADTLFGHKKGAFTGAEQSREGLLRESSGGTLFLDEIGDLSHVSQVKILRLIQEQEYYPLGSDRPKRSEARIIVATNRNLAGLIDGGKFRNDLFYRLKTHHIEVPPLRDRLEDVPLLLHHFVGKAASQLGKKVPSLPQELGVMLSSYSYPGNVRELETMVFDAVARHNKGIISMEYFRQAMGKGRNGEGDGKSPERTACFLSQSFPAMPTLKEAESFLIREALKAARNNQGIAASILGISRQALNKRINRGK